jgi:hypothetical protein
VSDESDDYATLTALQQKYKMPGLKLETPDGRRWKRRLDASQRYFEGYSAHWNKDRNLLVNFREMIESFGTYVAIAYPIICNYINDIYFRNPDPFIQDKDGNRVLSRILTDVIGSILTECDSETEMKHALLDQAWASFGVIAGSLLQKPHNAGELVMEEAIEPTPDGDEPEPSAVPQQPMMRPATMLRHNGQFDPMTGDAIMERVPSGERVEPTEQSVILRRISPWKIRFDPLGRRWDMTDHAWWGYQSSEYLADLLRDPRLSFEDKCFLMMFYGTQASAFTVDGESDSATATGYRETDPEFIRVKLITVWNRRDHMIYRMPIGASRTFTPQRWDPEWERADKFPIRYMPINKVPEDQKDTEGFIGLSWMRQIAPHIENINKLQGLIVNALGKVVDVYATWKGSIPSFTIDKISSAGREFQVVQFDPEPYQKYSAQGDAPLKIEEVMHLLPVGDTKDMQHMAKIDHEFGMIAQIFGQGPADRGGVTKSETATESLGVQQGLSRRLASGRNDAGKHYVGLAEMAFLIIQARRTLPIKYQMTSTMFDTKVWATFTDPQTTLKDLDLHFQYAVGSTEPQTREQQFALRERAATILMPIFQANQDNRNSMALARMLIEPLNLIGIDSFFNDAASEIVMQIEMIILGLGKGRILADNEQASAQVMELLSKLFKEMLTPSQEAQVAAAVAGVDAPEQGQQNVGSIAAAPSPGEASAEAGAAGSAAAGAAGGIKYSETLPTPSLGSAE